MIMKNFWIILSFVFYIVLINIPLPPEFRIRGFYLTHIILLTTSTLLIYVSFERQNWFWKSLALTLTLWLFTIPMLRVWENAYSTWNIVLGIFPWADAGGYYIDAKGLLWGFNFSDFSGRRPIFASFLAVLLKLTSQNLQITLLILTALNGFAVFLTAMYIRDFLGRIAATFVILMTYVFYIEYSGTTLTEQLGLPLGLLAITLQIKAVRQNSRWQYAFGLSVLTFALLTRAGPFFVLPFLFLFGIKQYVKQQTNMIPVVSLLLIALITPFAANLSLQKSITSPEAVPMGNFADTLYGQALGGKGWLQVTKDYPSLANLSTKERTNQVYNLAFQEIRKNPLNLMLGSLKAWKDLLIPNDSSFFARAYTPNKAINRMINVLLTLIFAIGIYQLLRKRNEKLQGLFLCYLAGIIISIPFLPPIDAGIRPYATIIAIFIVVVAMAIVSCLENMLPYSLRAKNKWLANYDHLIWQTSLVILMFVIIAPFTIKMFVPQAPPITPVCQPGEIPIVFELKNGSFVTFERNEIVQKTELPQIPIKDVERSMSTFPYSNFASFIRDIKQPVVLTYTINMLTGKEAWIVASHDIREMNSDIIADCGQLVDSPHHILVIKQPQ